MCFSIPRAPKFPWFEEETKRYRLVDPEDAVKVDPVKNLIHTNIKGEQLLIDGIPISRLSITGQAHIPDKILDQLGLQAGDYLSFIINESGVLEVRKAQLKI